LLIFQKISGFYLYTWRAQPEPTENLGGSNFSIILANAGGVCWKFFFNFSKKFFTKKVREIEAPA
jgi:hypothetical protein